MQLFHAEGMKDMGNTQRILTEKLERQKKFTGPMTPRKKSTTTTTTTMTTTTIMIAWLFK